MKAITEAWLQSAHDDLLVINGIIANEYLTHMVAFHAQQAIEKSFKAVLEETFGVVPKTHMLETLLPKVTSKVSLPFDLDLLEDLDKLYIDARYPSDLGLLPNGKPTTEDAQSFLVLASAIYGEVEKLLRSKS